MEEICDKCGYGFSDCICGKADAKPFSDEELKAFDLRYGPEHGIARFKATIVADRREIKILKSAIETDHAIKKDHRVAMTADRKRIEELEESNKAWHDSPTKYHRCREEYILPYPALLCSMCSPSDYKLGEQDFDPRKLISDQAAAIERMRGALEPFAIPFGTVNIPDAYGVFLGGLIKNNFIEARKALDERSEK